MVAKKGKEDTKVSSGFEERSIASHFFENDDEEIDDEDDDVDEGSIEEDVVDGPTLEAFDEDIEEEDEDDAEEFEYEDDEDEDEDDEYLCALCHKKLDKKALKKESEVCTNCEEEECQ